jgi:hypothetical protein
MGTLVPTALRDPSNHERLAVFDKLMPAPVSQGPEGYALHAGTAFTVSDVKLAMASLDKMVIAFKTPAAPMLIHMAGDFASAVGCHIQFREGANWITSTGTLLNVIARNRSNLQASTLLQDQSTGAFVATNQLIKDPNMTGSGVLLFSGYAFGAKHSPTTSSGLEFVLAPDTKYQIELTADGGSNSGFLSLVWDEAIPT